MRSQDFFKIDTKGWLHGTIRQLTPLQRCIWVDLLALSKEGRFPGWVAAGWDGEHEKSPLLGYKLKTLAGKLEYDRHSFRDALAEFQRRGMVVLNSDRAIRIVNWDKYQAIPAHRGEKPPQFPHPPGGEKPPNGDGSPLSGEGVVVPPHGQDAHIQPEQAETEQVTETENDGAETTDKDLKEEGWMDGEAEPPVPAVKPKEEAKLVPVPYLTKDMLREPDCDAASRCVELLLNYYANPGFNNAANLMDWYRSFAALAKTDPKLESYIRYAFEVDPFWKDKMVRRNGDPIDYIADKLGKIVLNYNEWKRKKAAAKNLKAAAHPPGATPPSTAKKTRYDITKMGIEEARKWVSEHLSDFTEKDFEDFKFRGIYG